MRTRFFLRFFLAALPLSFLLAAPVSAQRVGGDDDQGGIQILQAFYGTERTHVDVTTRLRDLARVDNVVRAGTDSLAIDPAPGQSKTLRVIVRGIDGRVTTVDYPDGSVFDGRQYTGWTQNRDYRGSWNAAAASPAVAPRSPGGDQGQYQILQAFYGTDRGNVDVTERLRELARDDRQFRMGNSTFGVDPSPGQVKVLRIHARGSDGQVRVFDIPEGGVVDGSQFAGWSSGRFGDAGYRGQWQPGEGRRDGGRDGGRDEGQYRVMQALYGTARRHVDVTDRLAELARDDRALRVSPASFQVDPDPRRRSVLRVFARGRDGLIRMFEYGPGDVVDGTQFRGWRGGRWDGRNDYRGGWSGELR